MTKRADFVESRREKRRKQIFEGAVKVFAEKGYHSSTVQEIADAAGLAKGTIYEYVRDKEEILLLATEEAVNILTGEIQKVISDIEDPVERLNRALLIQLKYVRKYRTAARVLRHDVNNLSTNGKKQISELMDGMIEIFRSVIDYGIDIGRFKKINSRIAAEIFIQICTIYFDYGDFPHQQTPLDEITDFIMENFVNSIIDEKEANPAR